MTLRDLHRTSAFVILAFATMHIANHLASLNSVATHIAFMDFARTVYRHWAIESLLLFCVLFQVLSGLWLVVRGWKQRQGLLPWLQAGSGGYLAFFLLVHVSAVLFGRTVLHLDTNFYYAAAGLHVSPSQFFFAPYYFLAVLALFTHLGCAAYWQLQAARPAVRTFVVGAAVMVGAILALLIVLSLAGKIQAVEIPAKYQATYAKPGG
jgi:succinate dehydrogenase/fumarate reductase cytochrome b subunit